MSTQTWTSTVDGRTHRVEAEEGFRRRVRWYVDDELAAEKRSADEKIRLEAPAGRLLVRFTTLGAPRRATLLCGDGPLDDGIDLTPEPDSKAARHEQAVRDHPERYALVQAAGGVAKVVVPILLTVLLARVAFSLPLPSIPTPDLPSLPRPDLPSLPLPDLPDLPDWSPPGWVERVLDVAHYVWPVVLAYVLARAEIRRRRRQDDQRRQDDPGESR
ncbi:hypothetical protein [Nocardioides sp. YIM 152315]|uniref:hypothetical protein n=1 Tax=Nocardioides sp. YIM 152315 TaxID=3031760 RepID=UPI0023DC5304|nr:hypothetical protein [Nocardioides sp. YIM 152315]MDF1603276.1 hypothetical protein [Nocardioides sp. YIM 152315]